MKPKRSARQRSYSSRPQANGATIASYVVNEYDVRDSKVFLIKTRDDPIMGRRCYGIGLDSECGISIEGARLHRRPLADRRGQ